MKLYREVKTSERLPEENGEYIVFTDEDSPSLEWEPFKVGVGWWTETIGPRHLKIKIWLEPIDITKGEIKKAASEYEKIACCEKDHPFLKEYVNEDFEAGANWVISQSNSKPN